MQEQEEKQENPLQCAKGGRRETEAKMEGEGLQLPVFSAYLGERREWVCTAQDTPRPCSGHVGHFLST